MKDKLSSYFSVGIMGEYFIMVDRTSYQHYYISKTNLDGVKLNYKVPIGLMSVTTALIRLLDAKGYQANILVLLICYLISYLSAVAFLCQLNSLEIEIKVYHFENSEKLEDFIKSSIAHANMILYFVAGFGLVAGISGIFYLTIQSFLFLFISPLFSWCMFLLLRLEPVKRRVFLSKLEKENHHR